MVDTITFVYKLDGIKNPKFERLNGTTGSVAVDDIINLKRDELILHATVQFVKEIEGESIVVDATIRNTHIFKSSQNSYVYVKGLEHFPNTNHHNDMNAMYSLVYKQQENQKELFEDYMKRLLPSSLSPSSSAPSTSSASISSPSTSSPSSPEPKYRPGNDYSSFLFNYYLFDIFLKLI